MYHLTVINTDGSKVKSSQEHCPDLKQLHEAVGGYIESVPYWQEWQAEPCVVFCNEEGKLMKLPINEVATVHWRVALLPHEIDDVLCGNVIIIQADTQQEMDEI
jgi:hypothetical protein